MYETDIKEQVKRAHEWAEENGYILLLMDTWDDGLGTCREKGLLYDVCRIDLLGPVKIGTVRILAIRSLRITQDTTEEDYDTPLDTKAMYRYMLSGEE